MTIADHGLELAATYYLHSHAHVFDQIGKAGWWRCHVGMHASMHACFLSFPTGQKMEVPTVVPERCASMAWLRSIPGTREQFKQLRESSTSIEYC